VSESEVPKGEEGAATSDDAIPAQMTDGAEVLFRQVHPDLMHAGEPASSVFVPTPADKGKLSVDRSAITTAKGACDLFVANGLRSVATYGVTVGELGTHGLPCIQDPIKDVPGQLDNLAHALVDYTALNPTQQKKVGKRVKTAALRRGILHKP
jgi:hypothetical protein